ncbi:hypothetical protein K431DRAFT_311581 [Polychaeton citri CBS 116435]|uniref:SNF5-domain-containing protein n=1 Tax=Polychaeton citri CBS 116435 TaxID=1314669 RepID=A0A9P4QCY2_9PEZI|nr:hypothetical protein K431DRAFT_311581 [Polychaeton citri CBS 116435]
MSTVTGVVNANRINAPQAFVSSYAPRIRAYGNSLLTPVAPQNALPPVRTTKRGTTVINYNDDLEDDSIEDSDGPRRATGLRSLPQKRFVDGQDAGKDAGSKDTEVGREIFEPVDVQGVWREWMGKPKRTLTERQMAVQAALPTTLVPIRIDVDISPFKPEPALPTPGNARDYGIDENAPAYKAPDVTPQYRLKDSFLWNLHESLITPDMFARTFVDELDFPANSKQKLVMDISQQIVKQLEEHAATALHPLFQPNTWNQQELLLNGTGAVTPSVQPGVSRGQSTTPLPGTDTPIANGRRDAPFMNGGLVSDPSSPMPPVPNGLATPALTITAKPLPQDPSISSALNPPDAHRCLLSLSINLQNRLYTDKFEWSLAHPPGLAEIFARQTCADLGLTSDWIPNLAHAIYEASLRLKKDMIENGGSLAGVVGSGVDGWGVVENDACEYHGDGTPAIGVGAGWRLDEDSLGAEWEPRLEVLSKEEIEKREGDRERQLRRARRETARFTTTQTQNSGFGGDYFAGGLDRFGQPTQVIAEDERMGRGERSKKKRRFRSLSPIGRETPEAVGFGGTSSQLTDGEQQYWRCAHCKVWATAVWGVRDGPSAPRSLCQNCGLLYERNGRLPPWNKNLFVTEKNQASREAYAYNQPATSTSRPPSYLTSDVASFANTVTPMNHSTPATYSATNFLAAATSTTSLSARERYTDLPPSAHLYTGASANREGGGQGQISASTMADIVNYAEPGEDLDWTKITEPRERKRLQNIINGRKYRERRLATEGVGGSGGNYRGAEGVREWHAKNATGIEKDNLMPSSADNVGMRDAQLSTQHRSVSVAPCASGIRKVCPSIASGSQQYVIPTSTATPRQLSLVRQLRNPAQPVGTSSSAFASTGPSYPSYHSIFDQLSSPPYVPSSPALPEWNTTPTNRMGRMFSSPQDYQTYPEHAKQQQTLQLPMGNAYVEADAVWFDEAKYPTLHLGSLAVPAYVLPITLSLLTPVSMRYWKDWLPGRDDNHHQRISALEKNINATDQKNQGSEVKTQSPPYRLPKIWCYALYVHNFQWLNGVQDPSRVLSLQYSSYLLVSQPLVLLSTEYYRFRAFGIPSVMAALGWTLLLLPYDPQPIWKAGLVFILSIPFATQLRLSEFEGVPMQSGSYLAILAADSVIAAGSPIRRPTLMGFQCWSVVAMVALPLTAPAVQVIRKRIQPEPSHGADQQPSRLSMREEVSRTGVEVFQTLAGLAAIVGAMAPFAIAASFANSCVGWRSAIFGLPAMPPSLYGFAFLGGTAFMYIWCFMMSRSTSAETYGRAPGGSMFGHCMRLFQHQVVVSIAALLWTNVLIVGLWMALRVAIALS